MLCKFPLYLITVADGVGDRFGQLTLNSGKPGTEITHVLIQLLHCHQCLLQFPHPETQLVSLSSAWHFCRYLKEQCKRRQKERTQTQGRLNINQSIFYSSQSICQLFSEATATLGFYTREKSYNTLKQNDILLCYLKTQFNLHWFNLSKILIITWIKKL